MLVLAKTWFALSVSLVRAQTGEKSRQPRILTAFDAVGRALLELPPVQPPLQVVRYLCLLSTASLLWLLHPIPRATTSAHRPRAGPPCAAPTPAPRPLRGESDHQNT